MGLSFTNGLNPNQLLKELEHKAQDFDHNLNNKLDRLLSASEQIIERLYHMANELDALTAQVTANDTVLQSAITLINGIAQRIIDAGVDPAKLQALTASLKADDDALAAAVLANTPVVVEGQLWSATETYAIGDTVSGSNAVTYVSLQDNNIGNDPTVANSTFWTAQQTTTVPPSVVKQ